MTLKLNALISKATGLGRSTVENVPGKADTVAPVAERSSPSPQAGKRDSSWGKKPELPEFVIHGIL